MTGVDLNEKCRNNERYDVNVRLLDDNEQMISSHSTTVTVQGSN